MTQSIDAFLKLPLPEPRYGMGGYVAWHIPLQPAYSDAQIRTYAEQAVAAERERCAAICDARSADHWRAYSDKTSPHFCDARFEAFSDEAEECAKLIRGDNARVQPP